MDLPLVTAPVRVVLCHLLLRCWMPTFRYRLLHSAWMKPPTLRRKACSMVSKVKPNNLKLSDDILQDT